MFRILPWHSIRLHKKIDIRRSRKSYSMKPILLNNTIDSILNTYINELGENFESYRNHVYRVYNFTLNKADSVNDLEKLSIAAAFHDLGIWTNNTLDYLGPSSELSKKYCRKQNISLLDTNEIEIMINNHHKLSKVPTSALAEIFREADLIDLSFGLIAKGRAKNDIKLIRDIFPNKGFHLFLLKIFFKNLVTNPSNPFPIFKW